MVREYTEWVSVRVFEASVRRDEAMLPFLDRARGIVHRSNKLEADGLVGPILVLVGVVGLVLRPVARFKRLDIPDVKDLFERSGGGGGATDTGGSTRKFTTFR